MGFYLSQKAKFSIPIKFCFGFCRSTARSTEPGVGRPRRSTARELLLSRKGPGRPAESSALCIQFRSTGRSTGQKAVALSIPSPVDRAVDRWHNGHKNDRWASRPGGRPEGQFCPFLLPTGRNFVRLYIPTHLSWFLQEF